jgi:hypothetical protein
MSEPIEITLPEDSIIRRIFEGPNGVDEKASGDIKEVEKTLTDEEYDELMKNFLDHMRKQSQHNSPENKMRRKLAMMAEHRQRAQFRGLKPGFLTSE